MCVCAVVLLGKAPCQLGALGKSLSCTVPVVNDSRDFD